LPFHLCNLFPSQLFISWPCLPLGHYVCSFIFKTFFGILLSIIKYAHNILSCYLLICLQISLSLNFLPPPPQGARASVVGWGTMLQAGRLPVWVLNEVDFFQFT
jgi:hypothetical protein